MTNYSIATYSLRSFEETIQVVKSALKEEGFGVLTEIDVQAKMKDKLGKEMRPYLILGVCHPPSAYQAIELEEEVGLFLPCNLLIFEDAKGAVCVSAIRPSLTVGAIGNSNLEQLAIEVEAKLARVISKI